MTLIKNALQKLKESSCLIISKEQECAILERFGSEPDIEHEWNEQDIYEQIRKIVQ